MEKILTLNQKMIFQIIWNTNSNKTCCGICGKTMTLSIGAELYLENAQSFVCHDCGRQYAPDFLDIVEGRKSPVDAIMGKWPGDEPIEELLNALKKNGVHK